MSQIKTLNGVQYTLPQYNDTAWGANTGNVLTQYLAAIADVTLQLSGGSFTLTADADFGANFGLKALFLKSETANPASAGVVRLAKTDSVKWRNNANGADIALAIDGSDNLTYAATKVLLSGAVVNADINASAAIAYSKLALTGSIVNADIGASAAIAYSKLALTGAILNADLAGSIAYSKLSLTGAILNADLAGSIAYSKLVLTSSIVNADVAAAAAIAWSKMAALTSAHILVGNVSNVAVDVAVSGDVTLANTGAVSLVNASVTGQALTSLSATLGTITTADTLLGAMGKIINARVVQVVTATGTTSTSTTSSTFQATVTTASITPKASGNKILVLVHGVMENDNSGVNMYATLARGGSNLLGSTGFAFARATGPTVFIIPASGVFLDSPATTSATTYAVYIANNNGSSTVIWGQSGTSTWSITLIEIGA